MKTVLIDYGAGNLRSVQKAVAKIGEECIITDNRKDIEDCDRIILPGVGAFAEAKKRLDMLELTDVIIRQARNGKPLLGICLGMQLLFEKSYEFGLTEGLGLIPGYIDKIPAVAEDGTNLKIPHMGWNSLEKNIGTPLLDGVNDGAYCYFVHSFMAYTESRYVSAYTDYGRKVPALVFNNNIYGAQFHPEKSGVQGLMLLKNFFKI